jgi:hypothetical protein
MTPQFRKLALLAHITISVGWIGAALAYLALVVAAILSNEPQTLRAAWIAMGMVGWTVIVPLAYGAVLTGLVMALGTGWGLIRHYWVLASLVLSVAAAAVLLQHMRSVSVLASAALQPHDAAAIGVLRRALGGELLHAGLGVVVLLAIEGLNVYKPQGMTPYGRRVAPIPGAVRPVGAGASGVRLQPAPCIRWGRVVGMHAIGIAILVTLMHLAGAGLRLH